MYQIDIFKRGVTVMSEAVKVRYIYDTAANIELIFCDNSTISYPVHNHISIFTIYRDGSKGITYSNSG